VLRTVIVVLVACLALLLAAPAVSPVQLSYVTSDSMEPTLATGDGYVLVSTGTVETGDIVTYYSERREAYVTHRVVGSSASGFTTRGDANPTTDQAAGYPPVARSAIVGQVVTVGGGPVVVPRLGTAVELLGQYWYVIAALLAAYVVFGSGVGDRRRGRDRQPRSREIVVPVLAVAFLLGVVMVSSAAVTASETYTITETSEATLGGIPAGQASSEVVTIRTTQSPVTHTITDADGAVVANATVSTAGDWELSYEGVLAPLRAAIAQPATTNVTAAIPPQGQTGTHTVTFRLHPYPAVLPEGVVRWLHEIHPLVAASVTVGLPLSLAGVLYWLLVDPTTPLRGPRYRAGPSFWRKD
jgi:signal peptidase